MEMQEADAMDPREQRPRVAGWLVLVASMHAGAAAAVEPAQPAPPRIAETQLTLQLELFRGRATVIAVADQTLTIVTAAHFLSAEDAGKPILVQHSDWLFGHIAAVTRHPNFHPPRARNSGEPLPVGTLGVDTAVAEIRVELHDEDDRRVFAKIRPAMLSSVPIPGRPDQILNVHIVDQFGEEHVVRAGNHLNPRCLAWGRRGYDTQRGDSGAGVFFLRKTSEGDTWPVLIGNVSQADDRGGIASLTHRNEPWLAKAVGGR